VTIKYVGRIGGIGMGEGAACVSEAGEPTDQPTAGGMDQEMGKMWETQEPKPDSHC